MCTWGSPAVPSANARKPITISSADRITLSITVKSFEYERRGAKWGRIHMAHPAPLRRKSRGRRQCSHARQLCRSGNPSRVSPAASFTPPWQPTLRFWRPTVARPLLWATHGGLIAEVDQVVFVGPIKEKGKWQRSNGKVGEDFNERSNRMIRTGFAESILSLPSSACPAGTGGTAIRAQHAGKHPVSSDHSPPRTANPKVGEHPC